MGRPPCCEKMGLKRGPWTPQEDEALITYINHHGHSNWRTLPKLAGLMRCGKSCRLRWMNYLRPDIKRGNLTKSEEETIIRLHEQLGNKWSVIAARLPGRTDNEIKNVWNSHLKKRVQRRPGPGSGPGIRLLDPRVGNRCAVESTWPADSSSDGSAAATATGYGVYAEADWVDVWPEDFAGGGFGWDLSDMSYDVFGSFRPEDFVELTELW